MCAFSSSALEVSLRKAPSCLPLGFPTALHPPKHGVFASDFKLIIFTSLCPPPFFFSGGWLEQSVIENGNDIFHMGCSECCEYLASLVICALLDFMQRRSRMSLMI